MQNSTENGRGFLIILSSLLIMLLSVGGIFINQENRNAKERIVFEDHENLLEVEKESEEDGREKAEQENYENLNGSETGDLVE